jgi:hypothetical protein
MTSDGQGTLVDAWKTDAGPRRLLYVHETDFDFRSDEMEPSAPNAIAAAHRALAVDEARNTQLVADVTAALRRGRNCLVLTRRVAHVEHLTSLLASRGYQALVLQGGMSTSDRRAAVNRLAEAKARLHESIGGPALTGSRAGPATRATLVASQRSIRPHILYRWHRSGTRRLRR